MSSLTTLEDVEATVNGLFVLLCGFLCFLLQAGFGLLEVGSVREKNATNIMLKNLMDAAVSALAYWAFGYAFAYGEGANPFVGNSYYFLVGSEDYVGFFFQWVFAGTTATIVSGAVAERCRFRAYLIYSVVLSGIIYPIVCHWIWDSDGFLYGKVAGFSGSGAVHMVGGAAAGTAAYFLGPRIGKFVKNERTERLEPVDIPGHNAVLAALGTLILWFGFLPFNAGAGYAIAGVDASISTGRAVVVTVLAGASGAVALLAYGQIRHRSWDLAFAMNGLLGGMVATCSGVNVYDTWVAVVIGILGAGGFFVQDWIFENVLYIDDPLAASALHMGSGIVGLVSVGFFADGKYVDYDPDKAGVFFGGNGLQLGYQLYGLVVYLAWASGTSAIMFWTLNRLDWFRVSEESERMGMDVHHHGREAYPRPSVKYDPSKNPSQTTAVEEPPASSFIGRGSYVIDTDELHGGNHAVDLDVTKQVVAEEDGDDNHSHQQQQECVLEKKDHVTFQVDDEHGDHVMTGHPSHETLYRRRPSKRHSFLPQGQS